MALEELAEETAAVAGRQLRIVRPRDSESLIDEDRFEDDEFMPYWAELWPSSLALAEAVSARALRRARTLELGCGLGLVSVAAVLAGARATASDWAPGSLRFTERNAALNNVRLETLLCDWSQPAALLERAPWDLVLASDVLYEPRNADMLAELLPKLGSEVLLADPGRPGCVYFLELIEGSLTRRTTTRRVGGVTVSIHQLRPAPAGDSHA
jgi:predicted nicotinamide N-methyase